MPKNKFQGVVFSIIMAFCMVYLMTAYNIVLNSGALTLQTFALTIKEMWLEYVVVFIVINLFVTKLAMYLTFRILTPDVDKPIFITLGIQSFTVCIMVPLMTLFATLAHGGVNDWFVNWITTAFKSFPVAFFMQIFFIGPFVRFIFRRIFPDKKPAQQPAKAEVSKF